MASRGFPVHAGIDRRRNAVVTLPRWIPRTRGDRPRDVILAGVRDWDSPYTRG